MLVLPVPRLSAQRKPSALGLENVRVLDYQIIIIRMENYQEVLRGPHVKYWTEPVSNIIFGFSIFCARMVLMVLMVLMFLYCKWNFHLKWQYVYCLAHTCTYWGIHCSGSQPIVPNRLGRGCHRHHDVRIAVGGLEGKLVFWRIAGGGLWLDKRCASVIMSMLQRTHFLVCRSRYLILFWGVILLQKNNIFSKKNFIWKDL